MLNQALFDRTDDWAPERVVGPGPLCVQVGEDSDLLRHLCCTASVIVWVRTRRLPPATHSGENVSRITGTVAVLAERLDRLRGVGAIRATAVGDYLALARKLANAPLPSRPASGLPFGVRRLPHTGSTCAPTSRSRWPQRSASQNGHPAGWPRLRRPAGSPSGWSPMSNSRPTRSKPA